MRVGLGSEESPGGKSVQWGITEWKKKNRFHNFILMPIPIIESGGKIPGI